MELTLNNLTKRYGKKTAVDNFSVTLTPGMHALLGANGSGKTTLMRMLCDVLRPTAGGISWDREPITEAAEYYRSQLGYLPQNFGHYPNFTGWDFMMYLSALKGLPKITAQEQCKELLDLVDLTQVRNKKIKTYSGGMRQRLGIAQALLGDPKLLVLDEPTAGLDPKERAKFRNLISRLSGDRIVLLSTHIVSDVETIADDILLMKEGKLLLQGDEQSVCSAIEGRVWICRLSPEQARQMEQIHLISALRHAGEEIELRIIADEMPCPSAVPVTPGLEDLYLYYFREKDEA